MIDGSGALVEEASLAWMPTRGAQGCIHSVFRNEYPTAVRPEEKC
jgi:hypothetical protein